MPDPFALVLGVAQDGGHPQPGCRLACCRDVPRAHRPACLALVDGDRRWLVDATPALPSQLADLDEAAPGSLDGVLLTHAHVGHYLGLAYLGREGMGLRGLPLYAMPRMAAFLAENGPWRQLVELGNVRLVVGDKARLGDRLVATAIRVPHRDEYAETVAWRIQGPRRALLWLPDVDAWDRPLAALLDDVDVAFLDGTFWADGELARDMSEIPHPRISRTLELLEALPAATRAKVRFVHLNHTNPALRPGSPEAAAVLAAGAAIAEEGERVLL